MSSPLIKSILLVLFLMSSTKLCQAQDNYIQSIGIRGGPVAGATYKRFLGVPGAIEGIVGINFNGRLFTMTGLYEHHFALGYHLNVYGGGGLTIAFNSSEFRLPLEAIGGFEYTMPKFPLNIGIDYKPSFNMLKAELIWNEFGIFARYIF
ncbi:MAG: hypothetical protein AAFP19_07530 [Bacteroidota bacterium]